MNRWIEQYLKEYEEKIQSEADRLRNKNMPQITAQLYDLYEQTGDRLQFEDIYFERRYFLIIFGMASILFHKEKDIRKLEEIMTDICTEECWALPAHVDRRKANWRNTVELYASETAQALTEISSILEGELSCDTQNLIKDQVDNRVLKPFYESDVPYAWWETSEMNWCAVCAGSIGTIAIYRYQNQPLLLKERLKRINRALSFYMNGFSKDGVCMEGLDYWTYGMSFYAMYAELLFRYTHGTVHLMAQPQVKPILEFQQKCYFKNGQSLSFSDGSSNSKFRLGLTLYCASLDINVQIPNLNCVMHLNDDSCYHWSAIYRDYIWTQYYADQFTDKIKENNDKSFDTDKSSDTDNCGKNSKDYKSYYFSDAQWVISTSEICAFAVKGGSNDEPHNHNDIGSFLLAYEDIQFLADLGAGEYCKNYFNNYRYSIFCNNAESHNIPIINGKLQQCGEKSQCREFQYQNDSNGIFVRMNLTEAYEKDCMSEFVRDIFYPESLSEITIRDTFLINQKTNRIEENLVTRLQAKITTDGFLIHDTIGRTCTIRLQSESVNLRILTKEHRNHAGAKEQVTLMRWEIPIRYANERKNDKLQSQFQIRIN